ncbi:DUF2892 domain-containing protein, partial [Yoonia sp.]|uniref:YgaP family membrane protein n=1 Tax=Yoonia sp. TaxID=2212373 RepID=UPI0025DA7598
KVADQTYSRQEIMMTVNVGSSDRLIRLIVGLAMIVAPLINFMGLGTSTFGAYALMIIGAVLVLTSLFKFCPLYRILGISTCKIR